MDIVIISGMSGAGKSSALNIFEDMGYYSMDNLPPTLIMHFLNLVINSNIEIDKIAVGVDIRGGEFLNDLSKAVEDIRIAGYQPSVLFLDAQDQVLINRYKELRRPHPMAKQGNILNGIKKERAVLLPIINLSNYIIDTSGFKLGELKSRIYEIYASTDLQNNLVISVVSFGFKHGILLDADLIFDVRFLPNPFYEEELKPKTGHDQEVESFVFGHEVTEAFVKKTMDLLLFLLPYYKKEGKENLIIGIGCTGGKHRSVAIANRLARELRETSHTIYTLDRDERMWKQ